jgi:hypothetical protein
VPQDFKEQFDQQIGFLETSAAAYDAGQEAEAKRLAVNLRVLLHDTRRSVSLLKHLGVKDKLPFVDTAGSAAPPGAIVVFAGGLCSVRHKTGEGGSSRFVPVLDTDQERNIQPRQCFKDWWQTPVLHDQEGNSFARNNFVFEVANKDGGAHVDAQLGPSYEALTRGNSMRLTQEEQVTDDGWSVVMGGVIGGPPSEDSEPISNSIALASIRQITHEVLIAIEAVAWTEDGSAVVSTPICQQPFLGADISALRSATGRNDPCPCGSERKFKQCFLKKEPRRARM